MKKIKDKKKEIIKTILIIFLSVLLVLTFFSNTIMNRSLPEVSTSQVLSGTITQRVRGSGIVQSNQVYDVTVNENRTIDRIMIQTGQAVKKGDVLFTLIGEKSDEVTLAESELSALKLEYQKLLLNVPADYSGENKAIELAQEELNTAVSKRDEAAANFQNKEIETAQYRSDRNQLKFYTERITKLKSTISALDTDDYSSAAPEYTGEIVRLKADYDSAESSYNNALSVYNSMLSSKEAASEAIMQLKNDTDKKQKLMSQAKKNYEDKKYSLRSSLTSELTEAEEKSREYTALVFDYETKYPEGETLDYPELESDVTAKEKALEELISALNKSKNENNVQSQINKLDIEAKKDEIEKKTASLKELKERYADTEIKSKYNGIVGEVNIQPGGLTIPDTPLAVINITDEGSRVEITVSKRLAEMVDAGAAADIINNSSENVEAVLKSIKSDTESQTDDKILTFDITGDIEIGDNIDLSIPCGSGNYDTIVPKNALYQDSRGYFVLTVSLKNSPLGNRYFAKRIDVTAIVFDDNSAAVTGGIKSNDYVITASSSPIEPGDQVRLKTNEGE